MEMGNYLAPSASEPQGEDSDIVEIKQEGEHPVFKARQETSVAGGISIQQQLLIE